jgi:hypothetical protein
LQDQSLQAVTDCANSSLEDLREKIATFIDFFNDTLAKPFRWTYTGKPLAA